MTATPDPRRPAPGMIDVPEGAPVFCTDCRAFAFHVGDTPINPNGLRWSDVYGPGHCEHEIGSTEVVIALTVPIPEGYRP